MLYSEPRKLFVYIQYMYVTGGLDSKVVQIHKPILTPEVTVPDCCVISFTSDIWTKCNQCISTFLYNFKNQIKFFHKNEIHVKINEEPVSYVCIKNYIVVVVLINNMLVLQMRYYI